MKALVYKKPYGMAVEDIPFPTGRPGEVIVKVRAVGICGSDIHGFSGETGRRYPGMVMGHEISGEVYETGEYVIGFRKGQKVVVQPIIYCGTCGMCRIGETSVCLNKRMVGVNMDQVGGLSEFIAVPAKNVFVMPGDMPFPHGALVEPFAVGVGAVRKSALKEGDTVVIVGSGVIGLTVLVSVLREKPDTVFMVDKVQRKLGIAKEMGAVPIDYSTQDPVRAVLSQTGKKGADIAFEAVGVTASVQTAMAVTKTGGSVVWVGNSQRMIEVDMQDAVVRQKAIRGVYCYNDEDFRKAIDVVGENPELSVHFVEREVGLEDAAALFEKLAKKEEEIFRGVVAMD